MLPSNGSSKLIAPRKPSSKLKTAMSFVGPICVALFFAWLIWPPQPRFPTYGWEDTMVSDFEAGGAQCQPHIIERLEGDEAKVRKHELCRKIAEDYRLQLGGFLQQARAANAAEESAKFAYWQSLVSIFALTFAFFTFCTAVAAVLFAKKAADAANDSVSVAVDTSGRQLRAYVHPSLFVPVQHYDPSQKTYWWSFYETIINSGATPALDVETQIWTHVSDGAMSDDHAFDHPCDKVIKMIVGPHLSITTARVTIDGKEALAIRDGTKHFYVWGSIKYRDTFPDTPERLTKFCYRIGVMGDPSKKQGDKNVVEWRNILHHTHNSAT